MKKRFLVVMILLMFVLMVAPQIFAEENLLKNGDFEQGPTTNPVNWRSENGAESQSVFELTDKKVHSGKYALIIKSDNANDARMFQSVTVKPNTYYRFSGWIAAENVSTEHTGAILSIWPTWDTTPTLNGTLDWTYREIYFKTHASQTEALVLARLGMWGNIETGTAYFDDLKVEELKSQPATSFVQLVDPNQTNNTASTPNSGPNYWLILILIIIIILLIRYFLAKKKNKVKIEKVEKVKPQWNLGFLTQLEKNFKQDDTTQKASLLQDKIVKINFFGLKINLVYVLLIAVLFMGIFARVYEFGSKPPGLNQDEASLGYDTYSLANYGIDRNGQSFPVHLISWGSGQNALYAYIILPFVKIFGLSAVTLRIGNLLLAILAMFLLFLTVKKISNLGLAIITTFIYAISPWGIMVSRWGVPESVIPFIIMIAVYFYVLSLEKPKYLIWSFLFFSLSLYAYGVAYFVTPLMILLLGLCSYFWAEDKKAVLKYLGIAFAVFVVVAIPIILFVFTNVIFNLPQPVKLGPITVPKLTVLGLRYTQVIALDPKANNLAYIYSTISKNIFYYFYTAFQQNGPNGLVINNLDHKYGTLYLISNFFFVIGLLIALYKTFIQRKKRNYLWIFLIWFLASTVLGIIDETNTCRLSVIFIPMMFFVAYGIYGLAHGLGLLISRYIKTDRNKTYAYLSTKMLTLAVIGFMFMKLFTSFISYYLVPYADQIGHYFQDSFKDAIEYTVSRNPNNRTVYVTAFDQPYVYVLFYTKYNPHRFLETVDYYDAQAAFRNVRGFGNYKFITVDQSTIPEDNAFYIVTNDQANFMQSKAFKDRKSFKLFTVLEY